MKKIISPILLFSTGLIAGIIIIILLAFGQDPKLQAQVNKGSVNNNTSWTPPVLPSSIDFAGEAVPLQRWEIKEQLLPLIIVEWVDITAMPNSSKQLIIMTYFSRRKHSDIYFASWPLNI